MNSSPIPTIALIGDYSPAVVAHRAIPLALTRACEDVGHEVKWTWKATRELRHPSRDLAGFQAVWIVPRSPYENVDGVLDAIRWARESKIPLFGSCGGFQHLLIEFARNVAGLPDADHAETNPSGITLVVSRLRCSLVDQRGLVRFVPGSRLHVAYGADTAEEGYHCNYGVSPSYQAALEGAGLRFTSFDTNSEIRGAELPATLHPFFLGTLFQPERAALRDQSAPVVTAFVRAVIAM